MELAANVLDGPWAARIVWRLFSGGRTFPTLERDLGLAGRVVLVRELVALEERGIVERRLVLPDRVEYVLTPDGEGLKDVVRAMVHWGLMMRDVVPPHGLPASGLPRPTLRLVPRRPQA